MLSFFKPRGRTRGFFLHEFYFSNFNTNFEFMKYLKQVLFLFLILSINNFCCSMARDEEVCITDEACELLMQASDYYFRYLVDPMGNTHLFEYYEYYILGVEIMIDKGNISSRVLKCFMWWKKCLERNYFKYYRWPFYKIIVPEFRINNRVIVRERISEKLDFLLEGII